MGHSSIASTVIYTEIAPQRFKGFWKDSLRVFETALLVAGCSWLWSGFPSECRCRCPHGIPRRPAVRHFWKDWLVTKRKRGSGVGGIP